MAAPGWWMESEVTALQRAHLSVVIPATPHCSANQPTGENNPPTSTSVSLSLIPPLSPSKHRSVRLINGRCQKRCQSILCLFGFIWTRGVVWGGNGGMKGGGGWRSEKATWGEVVTEREGERRESVEKEEEDYGCSSAQLSGPPLREDRRDPSAHHWCFIDFYPACSLSKIRYSASPLDLLTF